MCILIGGEWEGQTLTETGGAGVIAPEKRHRWRENKRKAKQLWK